MPRATYRGRVAVHEIPNFASASPPAKLDARGRRPAMMSPVDRLLGVSKQARFRELGHALGV